MKASSNLARGVMVLIGMMAAAIGPACGWQAVEAREPQPEAPPLVKVPPQAQPTMALDEVRVGMRGYGLTVFQGATIEPFTVEVVSVMRDFGPKRGVIWIKSDDERLVVSGPVQGMSGSPIYLWDEDAPPDGPDPRVPGQGGRLIGAFAYGFAMSKECLAGVQPIDLMRDVQQRLGQVGAEAQAVPAARQRGSLPAVRTLATLQRLAGQSDTPSHRTWQLQAIQRLLVSEGDAAGLTQAERQAADLHVAVPAGLGAPDAQAARLLLPMSVGSAELAQWIRPMLEPLGLTAVAMAGNGWAGHPPPGIDAQAVQIEPGSVLSIPLGFGDLDLAASGTVTDVLPDGSVLAFGHAMFGQGEVAMPMASGFVHSIVARITQSFKLGGSLRIQGAVLRDENAAVVGTMQGQFVSAPVQVRVNLPGQEPRDYQYHVAQHPMLTPILAAIVTAESVGAVQDLPLENTARIRATMRFAGDRVLEVDSLSPNATPRDLIFSLLPAISAMNSNQHAAAPLESMRVQVDIEPMPRLATLVNARLDRPQVAPGDTLGVSVELSPYGGPMQRRRVEIRIPQTLPDGDYYLSISDAQSYVNRLFSNRPHLVRTSNLDELQQMIQRILSVRSDALFVTLQLPQEGLAIGRQELPRLPSSRRAMIAAPTSTLARPYAEWVQQQTVVDSVVSGDLSFQVTVKRPFASQPQAQD